MNAFFLYVAVFITHGLSDVGVLYGVLLIFAIINDIEVFIPKMKMEDY
jgi:hypothetical protein